MKIFHKTAVTGLGWMVFAIAVWLTGCASGNRPAPSETGMFSDGGYVLLDGLYSLPISENEWEVEKDDDGDLLFISKKDDLTAFSVSKWENTVLPPATEFEDYYGRYLEGIREDHPEAEKAAYDAPDILGCRSLYMGIRYRMDGEEYRVLMYLIPVAEGQDILSLTMTVPEAGADALEESFRSLAEGIRPVRDHVQ